MSQQTHIRDINKTRGFKEKTSGFIRNMRLNTLKDYINYRDAKPVTRQGYFKLIKKGYDIMPQSSWEENYYIAYRFKKKFKHKTKWQKLLELMIIAEKVISNRQCYYKRRERRRVARGRCFVCRDKAEHYHHIIQLQNGGYDNSVNRLPICSVCHREIHPWLKTKEPKWSRNVWAEMESEELINYREQVELGYS